MNNQIKALSDENLSWGAKGLFIYIVNSRHPKKTEVEYLKTVSTNGRNSINSKFNELIKAGYLKRENNQPIKNGKFSGYNYTIGE
jgi:hypothetical protein